MVWFCVFFGGEREEVYSYFSQTTMVMSFNYNVKDNLKVEPKNWKKLYIIYISTLKM